MPLLTGKRAAAARCYQALGRLTPTSTKAAVMLALSLCRGGVHQGFTLETSVERRRLLLGSLRLPLRNPGGRLTLCLTSLYYFRRVPAHTVSAGYPLEEDWVNRHICGRMLPGVPLSLAHCTVTHIGRT